MIDRHFSLTWIITGFTIVASGGETGFAAGLPEDWMGSGSHPQNYDMTVDTSVKHGGGTSGRIAFNGEKPEGFGSLMQMFKADAYHGKRVRMSAWMKTEKADHAQLWMRLDAEKRSPGFDNMYNRPVVGTTDWKRYEIVLDVPEDTIGIAFGAFVAERGQAWVDDFQFETVTTDVASTNMFTPDQMSQPSPMGVDRNLPDRPANLDFEGGTQAERKTTAVAPNVLGNYAGRYQPETGPRVNITREGDRLFLAYEGVPVRRELLSQSETEFFIRYQPQTLIFVRDTEGKVTHYLYRLRGRETIVKKIE